MDLEPFHDKIMTNQIVRHDRTYRTILLAEAFLLVATAENDRQNDHDYEIRKERYQNET